MSTWRLSDHSEPEDGWRCPRCEALTFRPRRLCEECEGLSSPEALAPTLRHAADGRLLSDEEIREAEAKRGGRL